MKREKWEKISDKWQDARDRLVEIDIQKKEEENVNNIKKRLYKPKTKNQKIYCDSIDNSQIIIVIGESGCGKTALSTSKAVDMLLDNKIASIIISRPLVVCEEELGFLPGDTFEKLKEYIYPMLSYFEDYFGKNTLDKLINDKVIRAEPIAVMRGRTFNNSFIIIDEAQNLTSKQIKMILTRIGKNSKMVFCGDIKQSDLKFKKVPLNGYANTLFNIDKDISIVDLYEEDILRNPLINKILDATQNL